MTRIVLGGRLRVPGAAASLPLSRTSERAMQHRPGTRVIGVIGVVGC
jgi:hypothetical protein